MALVNIESALRKVVNSLKKTPAGRGMEILSYKRNRGVSVVRLDEGLFSVQERGYRDQILEVEGKDIGKVLKSIMKREFPRSRKVRIYRLDDASEAGMVRKRL